MIIHHHAPRPTVQLKRCKYHVICWRAKNVGSTKRKKKEVSSLPNKKANKIEDSERPLSNSPVNVASSPNISLIYSAMTYSTQASTTEERQHVIMGDRKRKSFQSILEYLFS